MAVDSSDGIQVGVRRGPTARQRYLIVGAVVLLAVALSASVSFFGRNHAHPILTNQGDVGTGRQFVPVKQEVQQTAAPAPAPHPTINEPTVPKIISTVGDDHALLAKFVEGGSSGGSGAGARVGPAGQNEEKSDEFSAAMTASSVGGPAFAHRMWHPETTVPMGDMLPCTLDTAINSQLIGFVRCHLDRAAMNADGTAPMLDKGARVTGQIRSGLTNGQTRLFILWVRAKNNDNVEIDLASPAADELGIAGVPGGINTHFAELFWKSLLFSVIEYGPMLANSAIQNMNHGQTSFNNYTTFLTPQQSMANTILQEQLKVPPTLEKNQGDKVMVFVARNLHFDKVYGFDRVAGPPPSSCVGCVPGRWTTQQSLARNNSQ